MDFFTDPIPFKEAVLSLDAKHLLPAGLTSAEYKEMGTAMRNTSFFSARTYLTNVLDQYKQSVDSILDPSTETRADRVTPDNPEGKVTTGLNPATARARLKAFFEKIGYSAKPGEEGTIKDLSSDARINLVVKTNVQVNQGAGQFIQGNANQDVIDAFPAWELVRYEDREVPRGERRGPKGAIVDDPGNDWPSRFRAAAEEAGDDAALEVLEKTGRMIALKSSGVWQALGDGAGDHDDALGNPFPPFAFNTGMWTEDVAYKECVEVGLIDEGDKIEPAEFNLLSLFKEAA